MKINSLDFSFVYRDFKKVLCQELGKEKALLIWRDSGEEYKKLVSAHSDIKGDSKMMVLPAAAIYIALRKHSGDALTMLMSYGRKIGKRIGRVMYAVTSIPGVSSLLWKNMPGIMRKTSSPEAGYTRRIVSETSELVGVDIMSCPLHDAAVRIGMPEVARVVCAMDKEYMCGFKYIRYERRGSVAEGDECCDYRLRFDKSYNPKNKLNKD
jgi:hypothetical protein